MKKINLITLLLAVFTVSVNAQFKVGLDYRIVANPLPVKKDGVVEVVESFWYGCGGCYSFEPAINDWSSKQGDDVKFSKKCPLSIKNAPIIDYKNDIDTQ